jgi:hypothetical protein
MQMIVAWNRAVTCERRHRAQLRFCFRMTVAAAMAFAVSQMLILPFHGLWAVLTAVVVTQMSVGGSVRATSEYVLGTLCGAAYASAVGLLVPHAGPIAMAAALAVAVAPLAFAATLSPMFRVAPFTAVMVLFISSQFDQGPIESGLYRLFEVALGGAVAVTVSLLLFPERAHDLGVGAAARILAQLAQALPQLLEGFTQRLETVATRRIQDEAGQAVAAFQNIVAEAKRERVVGFVPEPDPGPLSRTLLRLRHDLVTIGRAAAVPLPDTLARRLDRPLQRIAAVCRDYLTGNARALTARASPLSLGPVEAALEAYTCEIAALREEGLVRTLSSGELEQLFTLGFALEQLHQYFADLGRSVQEWAQGPRAGKTKNTKLRNASDTAREIAGKPLARVSGKEIAARPGGVNASGELQCLKT